MSQPEVIIVCSQCRKQITEGRVFVWGELTERQPFFCSEACAKLFDPEVLTAAKIDGLRCWMPKNMTDGTDFVRASGDCVCETCGQKYYAHKPDAVYAWLRRLCDGNLVKL